MGIIFNSKSFGNLRKRLFQSGSFSVLALFGASGAIAQTAPVGQVLLLSIEGVESVFLQSDGTALVSYNGQPIILSASDFQIIDGEVYIDQSLLGAWGWYPAAVLGNLSSGVNVVPFAVAGVVGGIVTATGLAIETLLQEDDPGLMFSSRNEFTVAENISAGSTVFTAAVREDTSQPVSYSLSGPDARAFTLDETSGVVTINEMPDAEARASADSDNDYQITITASDGVREASQAVTITVTDENEFPPMFTGNFDDPVAVEEGSTLVGTFAATDGDIDDDLSYSLSGIDADLFAIDADGIVRFINLPDFEMPSDEDGGNDYQITIMASDGVNEASQAVTITVTNVNDNAPEFTSATAAMSVAENSVAVYTPTVTDVDGDMDFTYELNGADAVLFNIDDVTGAVTFINPPDFETALDEGGDNAYDIDIIVFDGVNEATQTVTFTVTNEDEAPEFASEGTVMVAEDQDANSVVAYTAVAMDEDLGAVITYTLSDGDDMNLFAIDETSGVVTFNDAPDFETPVSNDGNNDYQITIMATDNSGLSVEQDVTVTVTDIDDEAPEFMGTTTLAYLENEIEFRMILISDVDSDVESPEFSLEIEGPDRDLFEIGEPTEIASGTYGVNISFRDAPDYEMPLDMGGVVGDNVYQITIVASDQNGNRAENVYTVTVTNMINEVPVFTSATEVSVAENSVDAYTAVAIDDNNDVLTYSLSGVDAGSFMIDAMTGVVTFNDAPDFEAPASDDGDNDYQITISARDAGGFTATQDVTVTVTDVGDEEAPVLSGAASTVIGENTLAVESVFISDVDSNVANTQFKLEGPDGDLFMITDPAEIAPGVGTYRVDISFRNPPDFENPMSANSMQTPDTIDNNDNDYQITIVAMDESGNEAEEYDFTVAVRDDNDPHMFTSATQVSVVAGTDLAVAAYTPTLIDVDINNNDLSALTYSFGGGEDDGSFTINPNTGVVTFNAAPDFDALGSADGDNDYQITIVATDMRNDIAVQHDVTITVTDAPSDSTKLSRSSVDFDLSTDGALNLNAQSSEGADDFVADSAIGQVEHAYQADDLLEYFEAFDDMQLASDLVLLNEVSGYFDL